MNSKENVWKCIIVVNILILPMGFGAGVFMIKYENGLELKNLVFRKLYEISVNTKNGHQKNDMP